ncbi:MAG: hypothetical protein U0640_02085 [Phycisphaerales bacterium]
MKRYRRDQTSIDCTSSRVARVVSCVLVGALASLSPVACGSKPKSLNLGIAPDVKARFQPATIGSDKGPANLPDTQSIISRHNARVSDLATLRTPVTLLIDAPKGDGSSKRMQEQVEGSLQLIQPHQVSLRVDKVGQTLFVMGSNADRYWWIEFGDERWAYIGATALATPRKAAKFGLPVHPLDLIELAAITPLSGGTRTAWDSQRQLLQVVDNARWGTRVLLFSVEAPRPGEDPKAHVEVKGVWLVDTSGRIVAWSELSRQAPVPVDGNTLSPAAMARNVLVHVPGRDTNVEVIVVDPENPGRRIKTGQFDIAKVLDTYEVKDITDIDQEPTEVASEESLPTLPPAKVEGELPGLPPAGKAHPWSGQKPKGSTTRGGTSREGGRR